MAVSGMRDSMGGAANRRQGGWRLLDWLGSGLMALFLLFYGFMFTFSDYGPGETELTRILLVAVLVAVAAFLIGYVSPRRWLVALAAGLGAGLMIFPIPLSLAAAYAGARWRRAGVEHDGRRHQLLASLVVNAGILFVTGYLALIHLLPLGLIAAGAAVLGTGNALLPGALKWRPPLIGAAVVVVALLALTLALTVLPSEPYMELGAVAGISLFLGLVNAGIAALAPAPGNTPST